MTGRFIEYKLEPNSIGSIAEQQDVKANVPFILNGRLGKSIDNTVALSKNGFSYYVMLDSGNDLSTVNFIVTGFSNGKQVVLKTKGPKNGDPVMDNTVLFDSITSITTDQDVVGVSVGSIITATNSESIIYSIPIMIDFPYRKDINCILSVCELDNTGKVNSPFKAIYTVYVSQKNITNNQKTISEMQDNELLEFAEITSDKSYCQITQAFGCCVIKIDIDSQAGLVFPNTILRFSQSN